MNKSIIDLLNTNSRELKSNTDYYSVNPWIGGERDEHSPSNYCFWFNGYSEIAIKNL